MTPSLHLQPKQGQLTVLGPDGALLLENCWAEVELSDGSRYTTADATGTHADGRLFFLSAGDHRRPEVRWLVEMEKDGQALRLWVEVENTASYPIHVERLDVLVAPTGFRQTPVGDLAMAQTGWQSWSPTTPPLPFSQQQPSAPPPISGPMLPPTEPDRRILPWMSVLHASSGHHLLAGFLTARDQQAVISIQPAPTGHRLVASTYAEGIPLPRSGVLRSETLVLLFDQPDAAALERYVRTTAEMMGARHWPTVPTGWCSWYYFFTRISEADMLRNLDLLAAQRNRWPMEYIQLDDGYQAHVGDWLTLNDKFPRGMRFLTDAIHAHGFKSGLWFAPFLVSQRSAVYAEHPDWVLRDEQGQPIVAIHNWNVEHYALDTTHPEVDNWLWHVTRTMVDDWGYDYLKIDFIYAAALRGRRYNPAMTGIQAYRRGVQTIRNAAGDRFILGCGAPLLPSVGLVDGMRIGPDVAPYWRLTSDRLGSEPGLYNAVRSTLVHSWMHPHLWMNDPDCVLLRKGDSRLTFPEIQSWASLVALSGGMVLFSDDMSQLEPERGAIVSRLLPPLGQPATPLGPVVDRMPARLQLTIDRLWEHWLLAALFNWEDEPQAVTFDPAHWDGWPDQPYHLFDLWTGEHLGPQTGPVILTEIPPHGVRLLSVHADLGRPQLVGSTLHLLGGAVELAAESWADDTLTLTLACPGERDGLLAVYAPPEYQVQPSGGEGEMITQQNGLFLIPVHLADRAMLALRFQREARRG